MKPIIYQLLPRTFTNYEQTQLPNGTKQQNGCGTLNAITPRALKAIHDMGISHVWYTGVIRHATAQYNTPSIVKGLAGSPYAITDYYDIDPDICQDQRRRMAEFTALVDRTHNAKLSVIIDFVPNHVAREYHSTHLPKGVQDLGEGDNPDWAFSPLNNFYYLPGQTFSPRFDIDSYTEIPAKVTGNDYFAADPSKDDWYETIKLNYGVFYQGGMEKQFDPIPITWHKMLDILLFWASKGVDGFRCDMAEMVPVEFWQWSIAQLKAQYPAIMMIAEVYNPDLYRSYLHAGFDYLYDKVGMYEYLRGVTSKNWPVEGITRQWQQVDDIRDHMLYFLENHDEQRVASGFFCGRGECAEPAMIVAAALGTNPVMIYAGQEVGEKGMDVEGFSGMDGRSSIFDYWSLRSLQAWTNEGAFDGAKMDDEQKALRSFYVRLLRLCRKEKAITEGLMYDLEYAQGEGFNKHEHYAFLRVYKKQVLLVVLNFDDHHVETTVRIPKEAFDYLHLCEMNIVEATDLMSDATHSIPFRVDAPIQLSLDAWRGAILKINLP